MSVAGFPADPAFPQLHVAGDSELMRALLEQHLRPLDGRAYRIRACSLSRIRYRPTARCFLQYTLGLTEPATGRERSLWVTGLIYADERRAERVWRRLRDRGLEQEIPEACRTFEPVAFIPELRMLVQVFPYDRRLPSLSCLMAGPSPELERLLLAELGPGDWRAETWNAEPVRYREQLGGVLRYEVQALDAATGRRETRRFYVKVYRDEHGEQTCRVLRELGERAAAEGRRFAVGRPITYRSDLRALVLEEAPGTSLEQVLLRGQGTLAAVRRVARALAALNQGPAVPARRYLVGDQVAALERAGHILAWACPYLRAEVKLIVDAIAAGLEEVTLGPTHRDLKADHIFLDGDAVVFIDLDSFAQADPLLDPALLLARLAAMSGQLPVPRRRARAAARAFAAEYFAHVPPAWCRRLPLHYAGALLEAAPTFFRRQEPGWPETIAGLLAEAKDALAGRVW